MTPTVNLPRVPQVSSSGKFATGVNNTSDTNEKLPLRREICHWCEQHKLWQIMGTISSCLHLKVTLKKKCIYMLTLLPKGVQTKYLKLLWLKIFSICHWCQRHQWCTLSSKYLRKFSKKIENSLNEILNGNGRNWFIKNMKSKMWIPIYNYLYQKFIYVSISKLRR